MDAILYDKIEAEANRIIDAIHGGGAEEAPENDVIFYDYDGKMVYSYSKAAFLALTELPENPQHNNLISQGWNWSLQDAQSYVAKYGMLDIGQMYKPASGKTEIDIELSDPEYLSPYLMIAPNGTCTIEWGDGSNPEDVTGTSVTSVQYFNHQYPATGKYTISISGVFGFNAVNNLSSPLSLNSTANRYRQYAVTVKAVRLSDTATLGSFSFSGCGNCESVIIPNGITTLKSSAFVDCCLLKHMTIPSSVTVIGQGVFQKSGIKSVSIPASVEEISGSGSFANTYHLKRCCLPDGLTELAASLFNTSSVMKVIIPDSVTAINASAFNNCNQLLSATIPSLVTTIGQSVFYYCFSVKEYHFLPTEPPTLANSNSFNGILADTIIYVPRGSLSAYQTATNWSVYADYMEEEPQ